MHGPAWEGGPALPGTSPGAWSVLVHCLHDLALQFLGDPVLAAMHRPGHAQYGRWCSTGGLGLAKVWRWDGFRSFYS